MNSSDNESRESTGTNRYLISPPFFDLYWLVLRIVLAAATGGVLLALVLEMAANPPADVWQAVFRIIGSVVNALVMAFGMVTLVFALNERFNVKAREEIAKIKVPLSAGPSTVSQKSALLIKRADPIAALVFLSVALIIINVNIGLIGFYVSGDPALSVTPLFSDLFSRFLPWLNLSIGLAMILEIVKLITGRWTLPLVIGSLVQKTLGLIITVQMFADSKIFNPAFFSEIDRVFNIGGVQLPHDLPSRVAQVIIIIAAVGFAIDLLTMAWKGIRILFKLDGSHPAAGSTARGQ